MSVFPDPFALWYTRFGEAEILLPVAAALAVWMVLSTKSVRQAAAWVVPVGAAALVTAASKIAFIGWGVGSASIDFTGVSGHAMFSAAIYPVLAYALVSWTGRAPSSTTSRLAVAAGYGFAALIAYSRVVVHAHSWSEVISAFALGATASAIALLSIGHMAHRPPLRWAAVGLASWFVVMPLHAAPSRTQDLLTRISLKLSDRTEPFKRADLYLGD